MVKNVWNFCLLGITIDTSLELTMYFELVFINLWFQMKIPKNVFQECFLYLVRLLVWVWVNLTNFHWKQKSRRRTNKHHSKRSNRIIIKSRVKFLIKFNLPITPSLFLKFNKKESKEGVKQDWSYKKLFFCRHSFLSSFTPKFYKKSIFSFSSHFIIF